MQKIPRALDAAELRVLGALLEKQQTTPELYPLTVNALIQACNQKTAREPVMEMSEGAVHGALRQLSQEGFATRSEGVRVTRWGHAVDTRWNLDPGRRAVITLLLLRGPQTPGELRNRSERLHAFASVGELEDALLTLAEEPEPLVRELPRGPGQKESRWMHLLGGEVVEERETPAVKRYAADEGEELVAKVADLNRRLREVERIVAELTAARALSRDDS
ncbi:MAG: YceH family protein [Vicinamibacteria bacterium]|nr:YceH family protein [Vicinamibacteria bacterium]MBP9945139.1 YceH family protein [Vicinamibacteria bacterium]